MNFREAITDEWEVLLKWRNDSATRLNSINTDLITEEDHKKWFFASLNNTKRKIYIAEDQGTKVGTVRKDVKDNEVVISWTVAPEQRGKGYAKKMVKSFTDKLSGNIIAFIKDSNIASIKVAEYSGFKLVEENKGILKYEKQK